MGSGSDDGAASGAGRVPLTHPRLSGKELQYVAEVAAAGRLAGDGTFTRRCHEWLQAHTGAPKALLTHSCTAALDMAALLLDVAPGDEIIMPSFTFVSTANAFVLRGGVPVFVDVRADTLNIDEALIEPAVTTRTRAVVPVHYAGVACEMNSIGEVARRHSLRIVEDAAQGLMARYRGRPLGGIGDLGALSFHETKNVVSGEGGALLVNDPSMARRAEIVREKGTDRSGFLRGEIDRYTWQDIGSSYLPSEIVAAFLAAQLEHAEEITARRLASWNRYHLRLEPLEQRGLLRRPVVPEHCVHNGHLYYVLLGGHVERQDVIDHLARGGIRAAFHYVPLHSSPAGLRYGRAAGTLPVTDLAAKRLLRLPLFDGLTEADQDRVLALLDEAVA